jgi:hypothetical protein
MTGMGYVLYWATKSHISLLKWLLGAMQKASSFFLTAVGAARIVGGPPGPAVPLLLIFHGYVGADSAVQINATLRGRYPSVEELQIASIVDLQHIPRFMRAAVELTLAAAYRQSAAKIPDHRDPKDYVIILPDWEGKVTVGYGMSTRVNDIGLALITPGWKLFDRYLGPEPNTAALALVERAAGVAAAQA